MHASWARIKRFFARPLFGTRVIARDARVDPSKFPEDEFPTWCSKCGYLLRGLPDGQCPECGTQFERARLLVVQYVFGGTPQVKRAIRRFLVLWLPLSFGLPAIGVVGVVILAKYGVAHPQKASELMPVLMGLMRGILVVMYIAVIGFIAGIVVAVARVRRGWIKRRRITEAILGDAG